MRALQSVRRYMSRVLPGARTARRPRRRRRDRRGIAHPRRGERIAAGSDGQRRRPLHPMRPLRDSLSDRRDDDGAIHDHGAAMSEDTVDRRDFLFRVGAGAGVAAIAYQAAASLRSLVPNVSYDAPTTVKLGSVSEFPDGLKFLPDQRLFVFREG